jgi:non-specific serine/threonine protein kinase/serine/threonine-protein kinase
LETLAQSRGTDGTHLAGVIRGDLDWITLKALEKDRDRRYGTASELAEDLERYLENRTVKARPASIRYRLRKYVQRNRVGVAISGGAVIVLLAFAIAQSVQLKRITRERDRADRITEFMTSMFTVSNPSEARGNSITAREILDKSANDVDKSLSNDPELQAKMMYTMAVTYRGLGLYSRAQPLQERALEIQRRVLGPQHPDTLRSMNLLANTLGDEGHDVEAEKLCREVLAIRLRVLGPKHPDTLRSMVTLGGTLYEQGHYAEAEKLFREALDLQRQILGPEHPDTVGSMNDLASTFSQEGRNADAVKIIRATLEIRRRILGPDHPDTLASMMNLANLLNGEAQYAEAEAICRQALEIQRRVLGPDHPDTLMAMNNLATALNGTSQFEEAEKLRRQTLEIRRRILGPDHPYTVMNVGALALELSHERRYLDASKLFREEIQLANNTHRPGLIASAWYDFACGSAIAGQRTEAFNSLRQSIDIGQLSPEDIATDNDLSSLHGDPAFEALVTRAKNRAAVLARNATAQ